jgi:eukaryotic-like serine/threonine-protein kinase
VFCDSRSLPREGITRVISPNFAGRVANAETANPLCLIIQATAEHHGYANMPNIEDPNATRPLVSAKVIYRCTCGTDLQLALEIGGECHKCKRFVSPKILQHEMAISTICDGSFELVSIPVDSSPQKDVKTVADLRLNQDSSTNVSEWQQNLNQTLPFIGNAQVDLRETSAPTDVMAGRRYGHFELVSPLGKGGMGQVYRAIDTSLQRYVAVKLLKSGIPTIDENLSVGSQSPIHEVDKLLQEAITQARVAHPNIVTIYFVGKEAGNPFLAMELVNGKPLNGKIKDGPLPFTSIISIATQIADALKFSYELDLIHGDIKPSNILIQHDGLAKLSDFGMARNVSHDTNEAIGGTLNYLAPEILKGSKPSLQSDIYALGVTLYEMTFGHLPVSLTGSQIAEWVSVHESSSLTFPDPWPDRLPEAWRDILIKMLAQDPAARYSSYDKLIGELTRIKPQSKVIARTFPRLVAAGVDWISILALALILPFIWSFYSLSPLVSNMLRLADILPFLVYMSIVYFFRQSLGRSLMHIRVINKYGHRPKPSQMLLRSLFRMQFPLCTLTSLVFLDIQNKWLDLAISVLMILSGIFLVADIARMAFTRQRQSIHDSLFSTRVVIDMDDSS